MRATWVATVALACGLAAGCGSDSESRSQGASGSTPAGEAQTDGAKTTTEAAVKPLAIKSSGRGPEVCPIDQAYGRELLGQPVTVGSAFDEENPPDEWHADDNGCSLELDGYNKPR